jgi:hypothetical protein
MNWHIRGPSHEYGGEVTVGQGNETSAAAEPKSEPVTDTGFKEQARAKSRCGSNE